jgi:hypothetical protein
MQIAMMRRGVMRGLMRQSGPPIKPLACGAFGSKVDDLRFYHVISNDSAPLPFRKRPAAGRLLPRLPT